MNVPLAALILIFLLFLGASLAIGALFWSVRNKQFKDLNAGAYVIFDEEEPIGKMTDNVFGATERDHESRQEEG
jgi:cbb3-type cytochrome oxidase maturation protein